MKFEDRLFNKMRRLSIKIAKFSAYKDDYGSWWGHDTDLETNLPLDIQKELAKFADWIIGEKKGRVV